MEQSRPSGGSSEAVERLHQQLEDSLRELVTSEDWQRALAVAAKFHDYSFANSQLIWAQALARGFMPGRVAGYRAWQQLGRQVRKGEKGLQILAPIVRALTEGVDDERERRVVGYRVVHVWDIGQTEGEPLPEVTATLVEGDLPGEWDQVTSLITAAGFAFHIADAARLGGANGITDWKHREVIVRAGLAGAQRFKTAVHELAHVRLHQPTSDQRPACRGVMEVEAESVAYMVCAALGVDTASYSLPYVASWSGGDLSKVTATANRVIDCARTVLTHIEHTRHLAQPPITPPAVADKVERLDPGRSDRRRAELMEVVQAATDFYQRQLGSELGRHAVAWLGSRGINEDAVQQWGVGVAPDSWRALTDHLLHHGVPGELLCEAGVTGRPESGRLYDLMRHRIIFPIHDHNGRPRGLAGRLISGDGPKYVNSPATDLYDKGSLLYGLHHAHTPIREHGNAIVVEGYLDVIASHQTGWTNTVGTAGTALTAQHLTTLSHITSNVTVAFDGDPGGRHAVTRLLERDTDPAIRLLVARLPDGTDPADLLASDPAIYQAVLTGAVLLEHQHIVDIITRQDLNEPEGVARAIDHATRLAGTIHQPDDRHQAIRLIATLVNRPEHTIRPYLPHTPSTPPHQSHDRNRGDSLR